MRAIMSVILMIVLSVASATAGIRHYCDYQGNVRQVVNAQGNVIEQNDYYPYGGLFGENASHQSYKYSGKELERMNGLGYYDNNARFLDILTGSFISRDALAGSYPHLSPYANCANNPLIYIDPTGMEPCDPVENPQIRRNRASNLYGKDIRIYNGKLKSHQGFDYAAPVGTDVLSVKDGTVVEINTNHKDYGMSVTIEHKIEDEILYSFYAHLSEIKVEKGDAVKEGDIIGASGNTGNAGNMQGKDEHLHFELRTKKENAVGLIGKTNPNKIVDTKFVSEDPNAKYQNQKGVKKINYDGSIEIQKVDFTK